MNHKHYISRKHSLFPLGRIVATPGALEALENDNPIRYIKRHVIGDWGDVPPEDAKENELSLKLGNRILSSYITEKTHTKIWIITEADRSSTTILLPSEY